MKLLEAGDCLLFILERSLLRMRCGNMLGIERGHDIPNLPIEYACLESPREAKMDFLMTRAAEAEPKRRWTSFSCPGSPSWLSDKSEAHSKITAQGPEVDRDAE